MNCPNEQCLHFATPSVMQPSTRELYGESSRKEGLCDFFERLVLILWRRASTVVLVMSYSLSQQWALMIGALFRSAHKMAAHMIVPCDRTKKKGQKVYLYLSVLLPPIAVFISIFPVEAYPPCMHATLVLKEDQLITIFFISTDIEERNVLTVTSWWLLSPHDAGTTNRVLRANHVTNAI